MPILKTLCNAVITAAANPDDTYVNAAVADLVIWLGDHPNRVAEIPIKVAQKVRSGKHNEALKTLTDALNGFGHPDPWVRLMMAQGLIDTGAASTAIDILQRIKPDAKDKTTQIETSGLMGRAYKDLFLRVRGKREQRGNILMNLAIQHYSDAFTKSGKEDFWTGENLLALLRRAKDDGINVTAGLDIGEIAAKITKQIERTPVKKRNYWQSATLAVVSVSQGNWDQASAHLSEALKSEKGVDAFALAGTIRQLDEWWDINQPGHDGIGLIAALQAKLLKTTGGDLRLSPEQMQSIRDVPKGSFEKIFGANGPTTRKWLLRFLDAGASVGQITTALGGGVGTCFIVDGDKFHKDLAGERLILTNDHVVSPFPELYTSNPPLRVDKAQAKFEVYSEQQGLCEIAAKEIIWSSGAQDHDACLIRLKEDLPETLPGLPIVPYVPIVDPSTEESIYIIGHPGGRSLSYSMQNNELINHNCKTEAGEVMPRQIHYVTPTEPGSSGSPALNADLDVIGLHHAGGKYMRRLDGSDDTYPANEAIWIDSICRAARADLTAGHSRYER